MNLITTRLTLPFIAAFLFCSAAQADEAQVGAAAPAINATDSNGKPFNLADHKGSIVVLEWTNADCPFVKKHYESGNIQKLQKFAKEKGVKWVTVNSSADGKQGHVTAEEANKIVSEQGAEPTVVILDESGAIGHAYGAKTTPHMYVIDKQGTLAYMGAIDDKASVDQADIEGATNYVTAAIAALETGKPVEPATTQPYGCGVKY